MPSLKDAVSRPRRTLMIGLGAGALSVAAGVGAGWAAPKKMSQSAAAYQPRPKGQQRCNACNQWEPPSGCKTVEGKIDPLGWCSLFAAKF